MMMSLFLPYKGEFSANLEYPGAFRVYLSAHCGVAVHFGVVDLA